MNDLTILEEHFFGTVNYCDVKGGGFHRFLRYSLSGKALAPQHPRETPRGLAASKFAYFTHQIL